MSELLKILDVARELKCSTKLVRKIISNGELSVIALTNSPKGDRVEREELERYKKTRKRNRSINVEDKKCFTNAATFGGSSFKSTESRLDALLGQRSEKQQSNSNADSFSK